VSGVFGHAVPVFGGPGQSGPVVARVGSLGIRRSLVLDGVRSRALANTPEGQSPAIPLPPSFSSCVSALEGQAKGFGTSSSNTPAQLKAKCEASYRQYSQEALSELISRAWIFQSAKEDHLHVSVAVLRASTEKGLEELYPTKALFEASLKRTGDSPQAMLARDELQFLTGALAEKVRGGLPHITPAYTAHYYNTHKQQFYDPETRDIGLIHVTLLSTAQHVKTKLEHGATFKAVYNELSAEQKLHQNLATLSKIKAREGLVNGLPDNYFHEPTLNDPIFKTPVHKFGPIVHLNLPGFQPSRYKNHPTDIDNIDGYYVYQIQAIHPGHTTPLTTIKHQLEQELPETLYKAALATYITHWRKHLTTLTNCAPQYTTNPKCQQHKPTPNEPPEDPYTLN